MTPITPAYCQLMSRYNAWQNQWMFQAADALTPEQRAQDLGGFWGGISTTLSHLMWGDTLWIARFDGGDGPEAGLDASKAYDWSTQMTGRPLLDARIAAWAWSTDDSDFAGEFTWFSHAVGREMSVPRTICAIQMFNHQTHHRGQVHHMLTHFGVKTTDTDIPFMPGEVPEWV